GYYSSVKTPSYVYPAAGTYTIKLAAISAGCTDTAKKTITIGTPTGTQWAQGKPFGGIFYSGTSKDPDLVCQGDTETYEISPPNGTANNEYGTAWKISSIIVKTSGGTALNDTVT